jgi:hypothetical protein
MTVRIALDRYVYEDVYPAFKAATDEKAITAKINRAFLIHLAQRNQTLTGGAPIAVADIGCGPCDTLFKYLAQVPFIPGFEVRATDFLPACADSELGEALRVLAAAHAEGTLKLTGFSAKAGDAFSGGLLDLLSGPREGTKLRGSFRIVFASHVMYHAAGTADVHRMLADIATNVLAPDGVCIMYHLAAAPGTFQSLRARFGSEAGVARDSNTGAVAIDDPPAHIAAACAVLSLPLFEGDFITNLQFENLGDNQSRCFKDPRTYAELADSNPAAYEGLKRLYFVVRRAPLEFAADNTAAELVPFMDGARKVIEAAGGKLPSSERMQIFGRRDASDRMRESLRAALAASLAVASNGI